MGCYIKKRKKQWYGATIPYVIENDVTNPELVENAIQHWNDVTVARFVQRTNQDDYISFVQTNENPSSSSVGKQGGKQEIKLGVNVQERTVVHEIGHAVGLKHEHQRPNRDRFITVHRDRVIDGKWHNFKKLSASTVNTYGNYDLTSRMHYSPYTFAKPEHRYDWSSGWSTVEFYEIGGNTYLFLLKKSDGSVHVHRMNTNGTVGSRVDTRDWSSGWTKAQPFTVGSQQYLFLLKEDNGHVHIHKINGNGKVGAEVKRYDWSSGWSTVEFYEIGGNTYLFLLKKSDGSVHVHRMNTNGTVGSRVDTRDWSSGWTKAQPFTVGSQQYLFLLKEGNGHVHIHKINGNGKVGAEVKRYDWSSGWSTTEFYEIIGQHKIKGDGKVGAEVKRYDWSSGLGTTEFYKIIGQVYIILLKKEKD